MRSADAIHSNPVSMSSLAGRVLASLSTSTRDELCEHAADCSTRLRSTLESLFVNRFGGHHPGFEQLKFLFFVAPLVRRLVIGSTPMSRGVRGTDITFGDLKSWLEWLDALDPLCARMIDLRYFAGVSVKETARLLDLRPKAVVRELRFARAWLNIKT
ncbi:ECF-type sigma factor [Steroidobacter flavus]|uniref:ECF-type sigma factor n=1 Tax=Steroidobacter flavus TaxID=1842136 RepID=A0ABV8SW81_9GAMM